MAHFAQIDKNGVVERVVVATQEFIDSGKLGDPTSFVQTSYNTNLGKYERGSTRQEKEANKLIGNERDKEARNRKNYAGIGFTYDKGRDAFIPPKPDSDTAYLDEETCTWKDPIKEEKDRKEWEEIERNLEK